MANWFGVLFVTLGCPKRHRESIAALVIQKRVIGASSCKRARSGLLDSRQALEWRREGVWVQPIYLQFEIEFGARILGYTFVGPGDHEDHCRRCRSVRRLFIQNQADKEPENDHTICLSTAGVRDLVIEPGRNRHVARDHLLI